jgi:hypothetical protein
MRLIDAEITIKYILKNAAHQARIGKPENARGLKYAAELMEKQLTAYDVDKVVELLKESDFYIDQEKCITVEDAVSIVKGGLEE